MSTNFNITAISKDISLVKNIPDDEIDKIIEFLHDSKDIDGINIFKVQNKIDEIVDLNDESINAIFSLIYSVSRLYNINLLDKLPVILKNEFPNEKKKISRIIDKLVKLEVAFEINRNEQIDQLRNYGLPHLSSLGLMVDYRILYLKNKKEVVPTIICNLSLHDHEDENSDSFKKIVFQLSPLALRSLIRKLQNVEKKIDEELSLISLKGEGK